MLGNFDRSYIDKNEDFHIFDREYRRMLDEEINYRRYPPIDPGKVEVQDQLRKLAVEAEGPRSVPAGTQLCLGEEFREVMP